MERAAAEAISGAATEVTWSGEMKTSWTSSGENSTGETVSSV
eukprot:CAMPEP_0194343098 /NCGR_PEP_ID=MMETSP0171-20130528/95231_1 /TAXON_ID=218684 /ORGANISM="Corethron pennatum, Strain L29A3" /LENGTH=41 /DNA_ID= /DNA_START= /DNA_END= /DNA_ORIENTATION=